jgi:hypothetical protein
VATLLVIIAGMWWWGFDFGQIFSGFNRKEIESRIATLEADSAKQGAEATRLRAQASTLESELAMAKGAQQALQKQALELGGENAQLKEELMFLQKLVSDSSKQVGLSIQRVSVEPDSGDLWRYSLLIVRGGSPNNEFEGNVVLQFALAPTAAAGAAAATKAPALLTLPDDQADTKSSLKLKFKYYQRVEGSFRVPAGSRVTGITARAYESGQPAPRITRTLQFG